MMSGLLPRLCRWRRDTRGGLSITFALTVVVLMAMMGAAIDFGRWNNAHSKTVAALDAALLAAGRQLQTEPGNVQAALDAAKQHYDALVTSRISIDNPTSAFQLVDNGTSIEGSSTGTIKTPFLSLISISSLQVNTSAKASLSIGGQGGSNIEISIMLDVTESMCNNGIGPCTSGTKMDAMKSAAKDLAKIVLGANTASQSVRLALVPFSTRVRVADESEANAANAQAMMKKLTNLDPTWTGWRNDCISSNGVYTATSSETNPVGTGGCTQWQANKVSTRLLPCVTDRTGPEEFTDAAPGSNTWLNAHDGNRWPISWDSSDTPTTGPTGLTASDPTPVWNYSSDGKCWDISGPNYIIPLTSDEALIDQRIDALQAYGATAGALGTAWAWYLISPNWSAIWPAASQPGSYADLTSTNAAGVPKLRKIAVLMTDGDYNTYRSGKDQDPNMVALNAKTICTNMKAKGVEVFTVGFDLDSLPAASRTHAMDTLQSCGTDLQHFYNSLDASQLKNAFRDIALKLATLYISQ